MKIFLSLLMIGFLLMPCGCYSLRKKFIRKKNIESEPSVCADLKEYPKGSARDAYSDYVIFFRGWIAEATHVLEQNGNRKRIAYAIDEAVSALDAMVVLADNDSSAKIVLLRGELSSLRDDFLLSGARVNSRHFIARLNALGEKFKDNIIDVKMKKDLL